MRCPGSGERDIQRRVIGSRSDGKRPTDGPSRLWRKCCCERYALTRRESHRQVESAHGEDGAADVCRRNGDCRSAGVGQRFRKVGTFTFLYVAKSERGGRRGNRIGAAAFGTGWSHPSATGKQRESANDKQEVMKQQRDRKTCKGPIP